MVVLAAALGVGFAVSESSAGRQANEELKVGVFPAADYAPLFVGLKRGIFKKAGIDIKVQFIFTGSGLTAAITSGSTDLATNSNLGGITGDQQRDSDQDRPADELHSDEGLPRGARQEGQPDQDVRGSRRQDRRDHQRQRSVPPARRQRSGEGWWRPQEHQGRPDEPGRRARRTRRGSGRRDRHAGSDAHAGEAEVPELQVARQPCRPARVPPPVGGVLLVD